MIILIVGDAIVTAYIVIQNQLGILNTTATKYKDKIIEDK